MFRKTTIILSCGFSVVLEVVGGFGVADGNLVISSTATANMACSDGICEPTAAKAILNAADLEGYLSQFGNVRVMTTGQGVEAKNIIVKASLSTPDSTSLTLDAVGAITVNASVSVGSNTCELELQSGSGGTLGDLSFGPNGNISFGNTSDIFGINGGIFQLEETLPDLAAAANSNPSGFYALANSYDASADGTYNSPPISALFTGYFEALGNSLSNLAIEGAGWQKIGLFAEIDGSNGFGEVRNLRMVNVSVDDTISGGFVGGVAGILYSGTGATVSQSSVTGKVIGGYNSYTGGVVGVGGTVSSSWSSAKVVAGDYGTAGGLAGFSEDTISNSYASGKVSGGGGSDLGGLVAHNRGSVMGSFATGAVQSGGNDAYAGGLVGYNEARVATSYAEGSVSETEGGNSTNYLGGLMGYDGGAVSASYSTGTVTGQTTDVIGGVVGVDDSRGGFSQTYWDTTTSGLSQGAGNKKKDSGLTGLKSSQLRSGLPPGFDKRVWKEKGKTNHGFPYLIDNPPPK